MYPELAALLAPGAFEAVAAEAVACDPRAWHDWPEYHGREGGRNDWTVVPFVHTFPASDPAATTWIAPTCARCPATAAALRALGPRLRTALFSRLGPRTRLSAHTGWEDLANHVLRCHLGLTVPACRRGMRAATAGDRGAGGEGGGGGDDDDEEDDDPDVDSDGADGGDANDASERPCCGVWCDGDVEYHRERDWLVFDDSKLHKAFNDHPERERIVLIVDLARPEGMPPGRAKGGHTAELNDFISKFS